jgi:hypothetical protein
MSAKMVQLGQGRKQRNATSWRGVGATRSIVFREHLAGAEIEKLLPELLKRPRY